MGVGFACDMCLVRRCRWQEDFLDGYLTAEALRQSNAPRARLAWLGSARYNGTRLQTLSHRLATLYNDSDACDNSR